MNRAEFLATQFSSLISGNNWCGVNFSETLKNLSWQQATQKTTTLHSISELVFHLNYYTSAVLSVLEGKPLDAHDKYSFDCPVIDSEEKWQHQKSVFFSTAEKFGLAVKMMPDKQLDLVFSLEKYGLYQKNIMGIIEHGYYHLGQIVLIKKTMGFN